jgi:hypothetical protein
MRSIVLAWTLGCTLVFPAVGTQSLADAPTTVPAAGTRQAGQHLPWVLMLGGQN